MSKIDLLFYGSAVLCVLSFLLFCYEVVVHVRRTAPLSAPRGGGDETRPEVFEAREAMREMRSLVRPHPDDSGFVRPLFARRRGQQWTGENRCIDPVIQILLGRATLDSRPKSRSISAR